MKASGLPDLKARRKAHMPPTTGHPISPGGSRARRAAPRGASLYHPCALRAAASRSTNAAAPSSSAAAHDSSADADADAASSSPSIPTDRTIDARVR